MFEFEVIDELMLRATCIDGGGCIYTKAGAMIAHQGNNKFDQKAMLSKHSLGR